MCPSVVCLCSLQLYDSYCVHLCMYVCVYVCVFVCVRTSWDVYGLCMQTLKASKCSDSVLAGCESQYIILFHGLVLPYFLAASIDADDPVEDEVGLKEKNKRESERECFVVYIFPQNASLLPNGHPRLAFLFHFQCHANFIMPFPLSIFPPLPPPPLPHTPMYPYRMMTMKTVTTGECVCLCVYVCASIYMTYSCIL